MNKKILGIFLIAVALVIVAGVLYHNSRRRQQTIVYSTTYMLNALWASYKKNYLEPGTGRTLDPQRQNITTSEGESYTMLRADWQDDQQTFDSSWNWTEQNLKRPGDNLFAWLYGQTGNGNYGIQVSQGGGNTASDADTDIAMALILASSRWQNSNYLTQAKSIVSDIWNNEVVTVNQVPYMTADNLEKDAKNEILINPSYLSPAAYRLFAKVDPNDNWQGVIDSSYRILQTSTQDNLDKNSSTGLPPDWIAVNKASGAIAVPAGGGLDTNFGFDALRVPFRLALDYEWNHDPRDRQLLETFGFLGAQWQSGQALHSIYGHDGSVVSSPESPAMYGGTIGYFLVADPGVTQNVYDSKLLDLYSPDYQDWEQQLSYYDSNWAWFGLALYNNRLVNFDQ